LLESFKAVLEKEREAEKIIQESKEQAEKIRKNAQEKAEAVYRETYQDTIAEARRKSIEIKEQAKKDAESEAQIFIKRAEKLKKKLLVSAEQKFSEAVDSILNEILS
jgi:F0F1-type ATP synthase membrane subunit b/b'